MKKMYKENKTLFIILLVALICIIISGALLFKYFYFGNGQTKYGDRLKGIEEVSITDEHKDEIVKSIEEDEKVINANLLVTGKIIYIKINFDNKATLPEAQSVAVKSLDKFSDTEKGFYDIQYTLYQEANEDGNGFRIMGAKNVNGTNLVWNNNNATTTKDDKEEKK